MYFKSIEIENVGPIGRLNISFPINDSGAPKPLIVVGENGAGKTILLSHLVNALLTGKQAAFDDAEVEEGKVYKYRSPAYIKAGMHYFFSKIEFDNGQKIEEWQLDAIREAFEELHGFRPTHQSWDEIPLNQASNFNSTLTNNEEAAKQLFDKQCCLYFPVNRFEEPAWLNIDNLREKAAYTYLKRISRQSSRSFVCTSPLKSNRNWILDILFDRQAYEISLHNVNLQQLPNQQAINVPVFAGFHGQSTRIYEAVLQLLRTTLRTDGEIGLGAGNRHNRSISIVKNNQLWIPNLFQLSTGEVLLLNLFLSIIRDFDLSGASLDNLSDIKGIVIVDEVDAHLHARQQREVLPALIASFPNVQFILTTHSPLFVLGMEERFGAEGIEVISMPTGERVMASDFSEFAAAYEAYKQTSLHRQEVAEAMRLNARPILFVEGDYDIRYIKKAAELLGKDALINAIQIRDGSGFGNLDKIWRSYEAQLAEILPSKILLLYDCDTQKAASDKGRISKRVIPSRAEALISIGIENLLPQEIVMRLEVSHPHFIDVTPETISRVRGREEIVLAKKSVNRDEKGNLCSWFCENATGQDFRHFGVIFEIIESTLASV
jgi:predicted ATP-binding protein involved in virulence